MSENTRNMSKPISGLSVPAKAGKSIYPEPFASQVTGRTKRKLGEFFELTNFGVNLTELKPGSVSALMHHHSQQDEFIYILAGEPTLRIGEVSHQLKPGDCCGFKAGTGVAHQLVNETDNLVKYLEIGDRAPCDQAEFPNDDLKASQLDSGVWKLTHKDGREY